MRLRSVAFQTFISLLIPAAWWPTSAGFATRVPAMCVREAVALPFLRQPPPATPRSNNRANSRGGIQPDKRPGHLVQQVAVLA